jgi:hypothetical protein
VDHLQVPGVLNALLAQRGVDAVVVPGIYLTRDTLASVKYAEELNSITISAT